MVRTLPLRCTRKLRRPLGAVLLSLILLAGSGFVSPQGRLPSRSGVARGALDSEGLASFASFSVIAGSPIPLGLGALFRRAEDVAADAATAATPAVSAVPWPGFPFGESKVKVEKDVPEPRDLMWAFPSFAVFLNTETAPVGFPMWARWLCLATFWPGVVWYLYYKLLVEDDLRYYRGLGIGGSLVIVPFALGLFAGVFGEFAYGSLEGGMFDNSFSTAKPGLRVSAFSWSDFRARGQWRGACFDSLSKLPPESYTNRSLVKPRFYSAFAWIYLNQWFLYNKVNQLFEEIGREAPLDPWGLFVPGWNFVTGIRQIHFLAEYWAIQRGEEPRDAFAELFPFAKKPTLTLLELATTPSLWFNLPALLG